MERSVVMLSRDQVARRAFDRFVSRGFSHGSALEDWLEAEAELRAEVIGRVAAPAIVEAPPAAVEAVAAAPVAAAPVVTSEAAKPTKPTTATARPAKKRRRK